ncbi:hypothetical protein ABPG75_005439 [Micractinium tetrahymenae]
MPPTRETALRASLTNLPMDWHASPDPCATPWTGVTCNGTRVIGVNLTSSYQQRFAVGGTLAPGLAGASDLRWLELSNNVITGTLPPEWGSLSRLALLALNDNTIGGALPANWSGLTAARYIGVNGNRLTGPLPASWGLLTGLELLDVGSNSLGPDLPVEWGSMRGLQKLNLEANSFVGSLPSAWWAMTALQMLSVRGMCGVCGGDPFLQVVIILGSSFGWQCSSSNCYKVPLGFIGQAAIIAAIILVLATLCIWRRVYVHRRRRFGSRPGRSGSRGDGRSGGRDGGDASDEEREAAPPQPPVVVLQPDGEHICTARMDAEWAAALEAAQRADQADKPAGQAQEQEPEADAPAAGAAAAASPAAQQVSWWARLQRRRQAAPEQAASVELPPAASSQQALSLGVSGSIAASGSVELHAEEQQQPQQPGHDGISRRHSVDSGAAASGNAAGPAPLRRASTDDRQHAAAAADRPQGAPSRQRTSRGRQRPVPLYDIDLGQLSAEPSAAADAVQQGQQPPRM